jgi:hypothetical protein
MKKFTELEKAMFAIESAVDDLFTEDAKTDRWNTLMRFRSDEMNASPRGRHFIAKHGDPIDQIKIKKVG